MEKFISEKYSELRQKMPFSYVSSMPYLDFCAYVFERNGEQLIVWQDLVCPNDFPSIFMPKNKKNWVHCSVAFATNEDIEAVRMENIEVLLVVPMGKEYYYNTKELLSSRGSFKNRVNKFESSYGYELRYTAEKKEIAEFYDFWKSQREHESITFNESESFFNFCLDNLNKYDIKQVYVEIDGKLVGLAWGVEFAGSSNWVGLHLKVSYKFQGLSRFLHQERAKMFDDKKEFTLGTGARDKGIESYKQELGPARTQEYYYLLTGGSKK